MATTSTLRRAIPWAVSKTGRPSVYNQTFCLRRSVPYTSSAKPPNVVNKFSRTENPWDPFQHAQSKLESGAQIHDIIPPDDRQAAPGVRAYEGLRTPPPIQSNMSEIESLTWWLTKRAGETDIWRSKSTERLDRLDRDITSKIGEIQESLSDINNVLYETEQQVIDEINKLDPRLVEEVQASTDINRAEIEENQKKFDNQLAALQNTQLEIEQLLKQTTSVVPDMKAQLEDIGSRIHYNKTEFDSRLGTLGTNLESILERHYARIESRLSVKQAKFPAPTPSQAKELAKLGTILIYAIAGGLYSYFVFWR